MSYRNQNNVNSKHQLPYIQVIFEELGIKIAQQDSKVHVHHSKKNRHFHLQRVKERQLTATTMPNRIYSKWVSIMYFYQTRCRSIPAIVTWLICLLFTKKEKEEKRKHKKRFMFIPAWRFIACIGRGSKHFKWTRKEFIIDQSRVYRE